MLEASCGGLGEYRRGYIKRASGALVGEKPRFIFRRMYDLVDRINILLSLLPTTKAQRIMKRFVPGKK